MKFPVPKLKLTCLIKLTCLMIACLFQVCSVAALANEQDNGDRPNIVMIMCDDLGYADLGFNGATDIKTPSLDQLAKAGTICTSGYVAHPFCGPSRMGLFAGRYPHSFGAPFNLPNSGQGFESYNRKGIPVSETLISTVLQNAGYRTGIVGKWHMGIDPQFHPNERGFDDFYGFLGGGHDYFPEKYGPTYQRQKKAGKKNFNDYIVPLQHNGKEVEETEYMTDAISREATRFVKESAKKDAPFFLFVSYNAPHMPLQAKEEDLAKYAAIKDDKRRTYAAMVDAVDRGVGNIVDTLNSVGEMDDTLIVFLSDNGGKIGAGADNGPLRQGKGSTCEGGIRVPMFFHWPNVVAAGQTFDHPVSALDFYPTFAGLANADVPANQKLAGKDIWEDFCNDRDPHAEDPIFALRFYAEFGNVGVRMDKWKADCIARRWSLYDVSTDIGEENNLAKQYPEILQSLVAATQRWTQDHTRPEWFDNEKAEKRWEANKMPAYEALFGTR